MCALPPGSISDILGSPSQRLATYPAKRDQALFVQLRFALCLQGIDGLVDQKSDESFWGSLSGLLAQQPVRVTDFPSKRHRLIQPPFVAWTCSFHRKYRIFELLEQFVCPRISEAYSCWIVGKQISSLEFGILSQDLPS